MTADMLGKETALYVTSGNRATCCPVEPLPARRRYIVGRERKPIATSWRGGGAGRIQPQPLDFEPDGTLDLQKVAAAIKPDDYHFARTRLLCLENTQGGKVLPLAYQAEAAALAKARGLAIHLDGARIFNAAVQQQVAVTEIARHYDSVSVCLSKGLAAPVGSVLCGPAEFIRTARRWRKMVGGGMRQAGIIAAAGIVALTGMVARLADDHAHARRLADGLAALPGFAVEMESVQTNMVFFTLAEPLVGQFAPFMAGGGIIIGDGPYPIRAVTHYGIEAEDIETVVQAAAEFSARFMGR
jgi:threonine aldolase